MASRTRYPQKDTIRDNKEISSNLQSLHNEYPTLNSDKDKLPTFFKPFAGQAVLPAALVHYCLTQKPTLRLTIAIRGAVGINFKPANTSSDSNYRRWIRGVDWPVYRESAPQPALTPELKTLADTQPALKSAWPTSDEIECLYILTKSFMQELNIDFKTLQHHLNYELPDSKDCTVLESKVELLLQIVLFYTKYACGGRHLFLYMLLVSKTLKELRNPPRTPPKGTVYLFEKGNPNDVSVTLGKIASKLGHDDAGYRELLGSIESGGAIQAEKDRTETDKNARVLLDLGWMKKTRKGHAVPDPKKFAQGITRAIADLNGTTRRIREESGFNVPFNVAEFKQVIGAMFSRIKAIEAGDLPTEGLSKALAAAASEAGSYKRNVVQIDAKLAYYFRGFVGILLANGYNPAHLFSQKRLEGHGFYYDEHVAKWVSTSEESSNSLEDMLQNKEESAVADEEEAARLAAEEIKLAADPLTGVATLSGASSDRALGFVEEDALLNDLFA